MDSCAGEVLQDYVAGFLSQSAIDECEYHLAQCDSCRRRLIVLIRTLDENPSVEEAGILDAAQARLPTEFRFRKRRWMRLRRVNDWRIVACAALVVLMTSGGFLLHRAKSSDVHFALSERTFEARLSGQAYTEFLRSRSLQTRNDSFRESQLKRLSASSMELGSFYLQQRDFDQAVKYLEAAKQETPSAQLHNDLGVAYMESGRDNGLQQALAEFESALKLDPTYPPALFNIGLVYERLGQFTQAETRFKRYLEIDPSSGWAREARSKL